KASSPDEATAGTLYPMVVSSCCKLLATMRSSSTSMMLAPAMKLAPFPVLCFGKSELKSCSTVILEFDTSLQLLRQRADKLPTQRLGVGKSSAGREADTVITYGQGEFPAFGLQMDFDLAGAALRECMPQGVTDQLVNDQRNGNGRVDPQKNITDAYLKRDSVRPDSKRLE